MALIDEGKVIEAFHQIKAILFTLDDIPKAVDRLRLRFAGTSENGYSFEAIPYHPNIYVCVHELFYIAFKSNVNRSIFMALLTWYKTIVSSIFSLYFW
jgi:hypothetical protein